MNLRGSHLLTLDTKSRITIPAEYRDGLLQSCDGKMVISRHQNGDNCLVLYPLPAWEAVENQINALPSFDKAVRILKRTFVGQSANVNMNKNGRMVLPAVMRAEYDLNKDIMLVAIGSAFEVWNKATWDAENSALITDEPNELLKGIIF